MPRIYLLFTVIIAFFSSIYAEENFTGKIIGNKVRLRSQADLDSNIIKLLQKDDLLLVVGEEADFYKVRPASDIKGYVFRSYIIDQVIEANRVNIRLLPDTDSLIVGQLQAGDRIDGTIAEANPKWVEIDLPENVHFYVSKEYVDKAGDANYLSLMTQRKEEAAKLLNSAYFLTEEECKKPFNEMHMEKPIAQFEAVIQNYKDFSEAVHQAKDGLSLLKDNYLQKKIYYLEHKENITEEEKNELFSHIKEVEKPKIKNYRSDPKGPCKMEPNLWGKKEEAELPLQMKFWKPIEEGLFLSWQEFHPEKNMDDYYQEEKVNSTVLTGVLVKYNHSLKNRPGDYLLKGKRSPVGFLYSTKIDLEKYIGKEVTLFVSPRPNNNFAYPAYFVNSVR